MWSKIVVVNETLNSGSHEWVLWTDFDTSVVSSSNFLATRSNNLLGDHSPQIGFDGNTIMYVLGGTNFQYQVAGYASSGATTMQYALRAKLEFLGP